VPIVGLSLVPVALGWPMLLMPVHILFLQFAWIAIATVTLLVCVLAIPAISRLFAFERPTAVLLAMGAAATALGLLWFQVVKWMLGRRKADPALHAIA
jgi:hypothetical protein